MTRYRDDDEDDYDDDDRPRRRSRRAARDDWEDDHRGGLVLTFGIASIVLAVVFGCAAPLGLVLGWLAWVWGKADLAGIEDGRVDPSGRESLKAGQVTGIVGVVLNALILVGVLAYLLIFVVIFGVLIGAGAAAQQQNPPAAPPPLVQPVQPRFQPAPFDPQPRFR